MRPRRSSRAAPRRALLIDALGTLVALQPPLPALQAELSTRYGVEVSDRDAERALAAEIAFYRANMGRGRDADSLAALRRRCAEELLAALPADARLTAAGIDAMTETLLASLRFAAYEDARPALMRVRETDPSARVVVVSNWDVSLLEVLELAGVAPLVDGVVTSAAIGAGKPAPAIFHHALALAHASPGQAVHVGDSLAEDVMGAQACGISAVLLARDGGPAPPGVPTIAGLDQLAWPWSRGLT